MTTTTRDDAMLAITRRAMEAGAAAGSWMLDGNTSRETALAILRGYEDCDPEIMDMQPAPLSGEMAGESIPELLGDLLADIPDDEHDDMLEHYETCYGDEFWDTVTRAAKDVIQNPAGTPGWCCTDCAMLIANGETPPDMTQDETDAWLARTNDAGDVTLGREPGALDCDCWSTDTDQHIEGCERLTFSWSPCDVCGSTLGGSRNAVTFQ